MARIVEFRSSEQPHMSMSESLYYRLAEPLIYRDLDGVLGDIPAACCRRCGEVTLRSDMVASHLCTTAERIERLKEVGMQAFRRVVAEKAALAGSRERAADYGETWPCSVCDAPVTGAWCNGCLAPICERHGPHGGTHAPANHETGGREGAATATATRTITMHCHCGRGVTIGPEPWCEGCVQSAATCDCVPVAQGEGATDA